MQVAEQTTIAEVVPEVGNVPFPSYEIKEETERTVYHYERDPEFFLTITGGEWHTYSCSVWEDNFTTMTQAQEKKLDEMARMMCLEPGMKILDVGCGWGGPLTYMSHKYGTIGHGITISPIQIPSAKKLAAKYNADVTFELIHWQNLPEVETYDAIFTDEVIVHFNDLDGFFAKCHKILKPSGMMVNKEMHFKHSSYTQWSDRISQHVNKVYGYTGNYRSLLQELELVDKNNFSLEEVYDIPIEHYQKTMDLWLKYMFDNRDRLKEITTPQVYKEFRAYLKGIMLNFRHGALRLHIVGSKKMV